MVGAELADERGGAGGAAMIAAALVIAGVGVAVGGLVAIVFLLLALSAEGMM